MKFNIDKYMGNYAMHCKTEEEAKIFLRYLDSVGRKWVDGTSYNQTEAWYKDIYILNKGKYAKAPVVNVDGEKAVKMYGNVYVTKYDETRKAWLVNTKYGLYRF